MGLGRFIYTKTILIDDAGWGDLILGAVIGALKLPERKYMERRISVTAFQSPNFENKVYLDEAAKIGREIVDAMKPDEETYFKVCSGYILSQIRSYLQNQGFHVEKAKIIGDLQNRVERSFAEWCIEVGVPRETLENRKRFYPILEWVAEKFELRENLVKTGWKRWQNKWRQKAVEMHLQIIAQAKEKYG